MPTLPLDEVRDPREVGPYRLLGRLGEGGQGVVYLAESPDGRQVAVKMLKLEGFSPSAGTEARRRLAEEAEAAKRVDPFCTARVLDSSVDGPAPYVVSEYVPGPSLFERVDQEGPLGEGALTRLMIQSVSGLTAIHGAGIVHRDLKPSNLLLGPDGARVVDFGIARPAEARTHTGRLVGTPSYFSPEQLAGRPATMASDVFAWACTMVFAATGRTPFGHADYDHEMPALFRRIMEDEPDLRGVPERVLPLLRLCLDKSPDRRPVAWSILEWLLKPPARHVAAPVPAPADPLTADAFALLHKVAQSGPPIQLPPPGPSPADIAAALGGPDTAPPADPDTVPPGAGRPFPPATGPGGHGDHGGREPAPPATGLVAPPAGDETGGREPAPPAGDLSGPTPSEAPADPGIREPVPPLIGDSGLPTTGGTSAPQIDDSGVAPAGGRGAPSIDGSDAPSSGDAGIPSDAGPGGPSAGGREASPAEGRPVPSAGRDGERTSAPPAGAQRRRVAIPLVAAVVVLGVLGAVLWVVLGSGGGDGGLRTPERFAGTWQGRVSESNGYRNTPTSVTLSLPAEQETGTLEGSRCAGRLALGAIDGDRMTLRITGGPCENGTVVATLRAGGLDYELRGGGSDTGHGTLRR